MKVSELGTRLPADSSRSRRRNIPPRFPEEFFHFAIQLGRQRFVGRKYMVGR